MNRVLLFALPLLLVATVAVVVAVQSKDDHTPVTVAGLDPEVTAGRGATVPFVEYEAENAVTTGRLIGPDRTFTTLAAEASGRLAVLLDEPGQHVEFTLAEPADALTVRYAIPDAEDGSGIDATLGVYLDGERIAELATTSRYSWYYGEFPFVDDPAAGTPHHYYDEARALLGRTLPAGTTVQLRIGADDAAPWYVIDLADFEMVGDPSQAPADALDVTDFGADPTGVAESSEAFDAAIAAGRGGTVWIPPGAYRIERHLIVDDVTLAGAGPWFSVLTGGGVGIYGNEAPEPSNNVMLRDFAILGDVTERDDAVQANGVGGAMSDSLIENLWIQHTKVGVWFDGPIDGVTVRGLRILDQAADGLNFHRGVTNARVEHTFVRNTGDDALASWSHLDPNRDVTFANNTVVAPVLANGIAIYGGRDIAITSNVVADSLTQGGCIHVGNRFLAVPIAGEIMLDGNTVVRGGVLDPNWHFGVGAIWFYALDFPMTAEIVVRDNDLIDSSYEAFGFIGSEITGVTVDGARIDGAGTVAVALRGPGQATFTDVVATGLGAAGVHDCESGFDLSREDGNSGWDGTTCDPPAAALTVEPTEVAFEPVLAGEIGEAVHLTLRNATDQPATVASVRAIGQFRAVPDCPDELPPGGECPIEVAYAPVSAGERAGLLIVSDGSAAGHSLVQLSAFALPSSGNKAEGRIPVTSSDLPGFLPEWTTDADPRTYWESVNEEFPQTVTIDLGDEVTVERIVLRLPPSDAWGRRTQNVEILVSTDGVEFATAVPASDLLFDVATGNSAQVDVPDIQSSHIRLVINDNTGWPAAQLAELEIYTKE